MLTRKTQSLQAAPPDTASAAHTHQLLLLLQSTSITSQQHESTLPAGLTAIASLLRRQPSLAPADSRASSVLQERPAGHPNSMGSLQFYITGCHANRPFSGPSIAGLP
jgi:hypothetical protein